MHKAKERRVLSAQACAASRANRSTLQQLEVLNTRLGPGEGAVKERAKLAAAIVAASNAIVAATIKKEKKAEKAGKEKAS